MTMMNPSACHRFLQLMKKKGENDNEPLVRHRFLVVNEKKKEER